MHKAVSRVLWGALFVGGLTVLGAGAAHAADTTGEDGTASGNQVGILGEVPVTIGGNAISILGDSESSGGTTAAPGGSSTASSSATSGADAAASGNQVVPDIVAPIVASGNAISVLGDSSTEGAETSTTPAEGAEGTTAGTTGEDAIAGGNQVMPDADLPIIIGGNSISLIGDSSTEGAETSATPAEGSEDTAAGTTGENGVAGGNQVVPEVDAPITVSGNDVSVIRDDTLVDGQLEDGVLDDGLLEGGLLDSGLLDNGLLDSGLLDNGLADGRILSIGLIDGVMPNSAIGGDLLGDPGVTEVISEPVLIAPVLDGPLLGDVDLDVLTPVVADVVVVDDTTGAGGTDSGLSPLMATAALAPTMMLAATGVEALPLIGGIALMLCTGLGMVAVKRMTHANG